MNSSSLSLRDARDGTASTQRPAPPAQLGRRTAVRNASTRSWSVSVGSAAARLASSIAALPSRSNMRFVAKPMKPRTGSKRAVRSNGAWALPSAAAPGCHVASPSAPGCRAGVCSAGGACCTPVGRRDACGAGVGGAWVPSAATQRFVKSSTSGGPPPTRNFVKSSTFGGPPPTWMPHDANLASCVVAPPNGTAAKMSASGTSGSMRRR
mmetsp:Transcript_58597/g.154363  ORF Transcript_58597/g.154363 Transcript_58597/m.154363 type:complete len:209 (-) Transcript_58597:714-1340(-)